MAKLSSPSAACTLASVHNMVFPAVAVLVGSAPVINGPDHSPNPSSCGGARTPPGLRSLDALNVSNASSLAESGVSAPTRLLPSADGCCWLFRNLD